MSKITLLSSVCPMCKDEEGHVLLTPSGKDCNIECMICRNVWTIPLDKLGGFKVEQNPQLS